MKRAGTSSKQKLKWCTFTDVLHEPDAATSAKMVPVFRFSEGRGVAWDFVMGYAADRPTDEMLVGWIRTLIDDPSLGRVEVREFIGHEYIAMECKDERFFWRAMEAFLRHGLGVFTQCRLCVNLPVDQFPGGDAPLTPEMAERMIIRDAHKQCNARDLNDDEEWCRRCASRETCVHKREYAYCRLFCSSSPCYNHESSWLTDEGRAFVRWIRASLGKSDEAVSSDEEYEERAPAPILIIEEKEDWRDECIICMDAKANTIVLPCGHTVVCSACSVKLRDTNDARTCVRCRRPITSILE